MEAWRTQSHAQRDLIYRYECVLPIDSILPQAAALSQFRRALNRPVLVSRVATSADDHKVGSRIELFVSHGFRPHQIGQVEELLARDAFEGIDGFVVRAALSDDLISLATDLAGWSDRHDRRVDLHLRIADDNPATNVTDDLAILASVVELYVVALAYPQLAVLVDTFMDVDRGYFVRHGLMDRRCNLRPAGLAVETLSAYLNDNYGPWQPHSHNCVGGRIVGLVGQTRAALLILPATGAAIDVDRRWLARVKLGGARPLLVALDDPWTLQPHLGTDPHCEDDRIPDRIDRPVMLVGTPAG
jgi:hypothetical protein